MDKAKFWEKQYRRGHGRIVGICYRYVNDWAVAQDLAQDVFLKAMETFKAYRAFGRFDAWLTRIAVNHCIDYLRLKPDFIALESDPAAGIVQTAATSPGKFVTAIAAHKATLLLVTAAGVTGGAVGWQAGRHHPVAPNPANDPSPMVETVRAMSPDTVASPDTNTLREPIVATDSVVGTKSVVGTNSVVGANNYSPLRTNTETSPASVVGTPPAALAKTEETTNPDPVIINQKVPVRRTVVIRDTTIVSDTVYQVNGE